MQWVVLVPMKALPEAKSRLAGAAADQAGHARLVTAIRSDTVAAIAAADRVERVVAVLDAPGALDIDTFVQTVTGLNPALSEAADWAERQWPELAIATLVGDLPALRPAELDEVLAEAERHARAFVADAQGTGTTLLTARPGVALGPGYGVDSAARHARAATALAAGPGLRTDVDTPADLEAARRLGVGPATTAALATVWLGPDGAPDTHRSPGACIIDG